MAIEIGNINQLTVKKQTDISYTLTDGEQDIFLHFNQTKKELSIGEKVNAFLYFDQKKRLCATLETPSVTTTHYGNAEVVDIHENLGVFINIGIAKDILLSNDFLPKNIHLWPNKGEIIPVILKVKSNQLVAHFVTKEDKITKDLTYEKNDSGDGVITKITPEGITIFDYHGNFIYVYKSLLRGPHHLGEKISFVISNKTEHNDYNATTIKNKEITMIDDSEVILNYLRMRGGILMLGNKSSADDIYKLLKLSKSAFKRAVGALYKKRLITVYDDKIVLIEE